MELIKGFKRKRINQEENRYKLNDIKPVTNIVFNIIFTLLALCCIVPLLFVVMISISSEESLMMNGYQFIPAELSFTAYSYIFKESAQVIRSYMVTIFVTIVGTLIGLFLNTTFAYAMSRKEYKFKSLLVVIALIPMLFNGGMVSLYIVVTQILKLKDTVWALILPMCVSPFYIIILRTFFVTTVPDSIIESAKLDGATQLTIFSRIVLPISLPGISTVGLFLLFAYWGDYFNGLLFIDDNKLLPIQTLLMRIENNIALIQESALASGADLNDMIMKLPRESIRMAMVVLVAAPIVCTYPFFQRYFISGLTIGSVKG